jgi:hypothetical protein
MCRRILGLQSVTSTIPRPTQIGPCSRIDVPIKPQAGFSPDPSCSTSADGVLRRGGVRPVVRSSQALSARDGQHGASGASPLATYVLTAS